MPWAAATVGAEPVLRYSFPDYRMAVSPSADHPNKMQIRVYEHLSGYSEFEATSSDFPGTVETSHWHLNITASTMPGSGNVYLTARDDDGGELDLVIAVEVVEPFRPLPPVRVTCASETADGFQVAWHMPYPTSGFPDVAAVEHQISGEGVEREGRQLTGSWDRWPFFEKFSGLEANTRYQVRLRSAHFDYFGGADQPVYWSEFVTTTCTTKPVGYQVPSPELAHVHVFQGILVDTFAQGGRQLRVPGTLNTYGEPWRVPLILDKPTTVAAEVLFDEWEPDVEINGQHLLPHRREVEVDDASGRLRATFARTFEVPPASIEVATGGVAHRQLSHSDFKMRTVEVPAWTVLLVPVNTPGRTVEVGERTKRTVRKDLLQTWPFGELQVEVGDPLTTSYSCDGQSPEILRDLADAVSVPGRTFAVGLVGETAEGRDACFGEDGSWFDELAIQGRPYVLARCWPSEDGCWPAGFQHAFGHATGLPHVEHLAWCEDCEFKAFPYRRGLVAPYLTEDSPLNLEWVRAPLFWWHGLVYGASNPKGTPFASGRALGYTVYEDVMSAGWGIGRRPHGSLRDDDYASDHTYRLMLDYLRGVRRLGPATDEIVE